MGVAGLAVGLAGCSGSGGSDANGEGVDDNDTDESNSTTDGSGDSDVEAVASASFRASLSDDGSIPGHQSVNSAGTGEATFEGTDEGELSFEVSWENLEGEVNGIHIHGEGSADGGYLVRLYEPKGSDHADGAVVTGAKMDAASGTISDTITDDDVNHSGDYDGAIETVAELVAELETAELGERGGVVNIHTEHAPDGEIAGLVEPQ